MKISKILKLGFEYIENKFYSKATGLVGGGFYYTDISKIEQNSSQFVLEERFWVPAMKYVVIGIKYTKAY